MYRYDEFDDAIVRNRVRQFRTQVDRRISGALTEDEFKPLRLQNGLYLQLHAYMLRVAIPYGTLNARQMDQLAMIAERWDRGFGHFTTRQNIQYNWPKLRDTGDILEALADVGMHAIQTSGNCIRNVTADHFAGAAADEIEDPRPTAELLRQWSTDHPEFAFLPRKFKIAVTGSPNDRAVTRAHDIGLRMVRGGNDEPGYEVIVGGGLGRTPMEGKVVREFLPKADLLPYVEAILRVYNLRGRRDNKYKARIKILVHETGLETIREEIEQEFTNLVEQHGGPSVRPDPAEIARIESYFAPPEWESLSDTDPAYEKAMEADSAFRDWAQQNLVEHRKPGYRIVTVSLKAIGAEPGDATAEQMRVIADLARRFGHDEIRISHEQNVVLPHVRLRDLPTVHAELERHGLATANVGLISDIIACPGMDYCALATARSIPIAQDIARHFGDPERAKTIGEMKIKISGCINACGHHHVAHIGILGLDRNGVENYQITLGGDHTETFKIGERAGRGFGAEEVVPAIERLVDAYLELREGPLETFLMAYRRLGADPFKAALYPENSKAQAA
ncbi:nitrite/sulfite reductase [Tepidamorphus sp. 3E244]|uniref:nitrite/sulfite reductase n=1 Tax=Tepidamorphus sp. 3E244 TaxID=3385498 RepID=UPI0038FBFCF2